MGWPCSEMNRQLVNNYGNSGYQEMGLKEAEANDTMDGGNTEVRWPAVDSSGAGQKLLEVSGRCLRPAVGLSRLMVMMIMTCIFWSMCRAQWLFHLRHSAPNLFTCAILRRTTPLCQTPLLAPSCTAEPKLSHEI